MNYYMNQIMSDDEQNKNDTPGTTNLILDENLDGIYEIPRSVIIKKTSIIDLKGGKYTFLFESDDCIVFGLGDTPFSLHALVEFNENMITNESVRQVIHRVNLITVKTTFYYNDVGKTPYSSVPNWLINFKVVEWLKLYHMNIDNLSKLSLLPIKQLELYDIKYTSYQKVIDFHKCAGHPFNQKVKKDYIIVK